MLKDRRVLIEQQLEQKKHEAAAMYMDLIRGDSLSVSTEKYENCRQSISNLEFDLKMVDQLIAQGNP